jgi:hypothetical protein
MTLRGRVKQRSIELMKRGVDPEASVAIAVAEEVKKFEARTRAKKRSRGQGRRDAR